MNARRTSPRLRGAGVVPPSNTSAGIAQRECKERAARLRRYMVEAGEQCEDLAKRLGVSIPRTSALLAAAVPSIGERGRIDALLREPGA